MPRERELREIYVNEVDGKKSDYKETFDGEQIFIPANGSVIMERTKAVRFLGAYRSFDKEISAGKKPLSWRPAKAGAVETDFSVVGEHKQMPPRKKETSVESADPIKELEHLGA